MRTENALSSLRRAKRSTRKTPTRRARRTARRTTPNPPRTLLPPTNPSWRTHLPATTHHPQTKPTMLVGRTRNNPLRISARSSPPTILPPSAARSKPTTTTKPRPITPSAKSLLIISMKSPCLRHNDWARINRRTTVRPTTPRWHKLS